MMLIMPDVFLTVVANTHVLASPSKSGLGAAWGGSRS
jgi:hypothetical protein